jgi:beta-lactamase regulating signal transducer with metallopeptidase domain
MIHALLEAALRALFLALLVGGGLVLLRVRNVLAQKLAWGLVLLSAVAMPLAMRWPLGLSVPLPVFMQRVRAVPTAAPAPPVAALAAATEQTGAVNPALPPRRAADSLNSVPEERSVPLASYKPPVFPATRSALAPAWRLRSAAMGSLLYFAVLTVLLARLLVGLFTALRLWRHATPVKLEQLPLPRTDELRGLLLRSSEAVQSPVTVAGGVLLPAGFSAWDAQKLRIVLAHEYSHVRQMDFYLQLFAGLHAAIFWFSPLGWWLKRKLSDLSETISDRAGMCVAADGPSYAQVLLEFAALPRPTFTGVAMARTSNLSRRIERLLNDANFRQAFTGGRVRALAASLLVTVALLAATAAFRVQAAGQNPQQKVVVITAPATDQAGTSASSTLAQTVVTVQAPSAEVVGTPDGSEPKQMQITLQAREGVAKAKSYSFSYAQDPDGESHAFIVNHGQQLLFSGNWNKALQQELEKAQKSAHGNFLWFTLGGKSYIVDDPAVTTEIEKMVGLGKMTMEIQNGGDPAKTMVLTVDSDKASVPTDLSKKMEEVNQALAKLQTKLGGKSSLQEMDDLQKKLADLQEQMSAMKGNTLTLQSEVTGEQGEIHRQKMAVGVRPGAQIGIEIQNKEKIDEQLKSIIEQSLKDNKARPVE